MKPFFTVIITTYNRPDVLIEAIDSVLKQAYKFFELLIINDGSQVDYSEVERYIEKDKRVRYFYKKNEERSVARNFGIEQSEGDYICFLDDDDIYYLNHLQVFYDAIDQNIGKDYFYRVGIQKKLVDGSILKDPLPTQDVIVEGKNEKGNFDVYTAMYSSGNICIPKPFLVENTFDKNLTYGEDVDLWIRMNQQHPLKVIRSFTYEYKMHDSNSVSWSTKSAKAYLNTIHHWKKTYPFMDKKFIRKKISELSIGIAGFSSKTNKKESLYYIFYAVFHDIKLIADRRMWGALKKVVLNKK